MGLVSCLRNERLGGPIPVGGEILFELSASERAAVRDVLQRLVTALGVLFGGSNAEVIAGEGGAPYVLELGRRAGST